VPGLQVPEQAPALHTFWQVVPFCQVPVELQVWGVRPLHCRVPGEHTPAQAPATHA